MRVKMLLEHYLCYTAVSECSVCSSTERVITGVIAKG